MYSLYNRAGWVFQQPASPCSKLHICLSQAFCTYSMHNNKQHVHVRNNVTMFLVLLAAQILLLL